MAGSVVRYVTRIVETRVVGAQPLVHRYVASKQSAGEAASAYVVWMVTRTRFWIRSGVIFLGTVLIVVAVRPGDGPLPALSFALVEVFLYDTLSLILVYGRQRTRLAPLMAAGAVWQSEFMPDRFLVFAPQEHVALRYSDITTLDAVGDWSLLYLKGRRKVAVLPGSLVPEQEVERIRGHATGGN